MKPRPSGRRFPATVVVVAGSAVIAFLAWNQVTFNTPSFDGAMNLQLPVSLAAGDGYATRYDAVGPFSLQTGPPLLLPIAGAFAMLGVSNWSAQLPNVIYLVGTIALLLFWAGRLGGAFAALVTLLFVLATPRLFSFGLQVYGEIPALFFLVTALIVLSDRGRWEPRSWRPAALAGVALGLAVLTKTVMLIAVPALAAALSCDRLLGAPRIHRRQIAALAAGTLLALVPFEIFKLTQLGGTEYLEWWRHMSPSVLQQAGVASHPRAPAPFAAVELRFEQLARIVGIPRVWLALFLAGPYLALAALAGSGELRAHRHRGSLVLLASTSGSYLAWWLAFTPPDRIWFRRVMDGFLLHEVLAAVVLMIVIALPRRGTAGAPGGARGLAAAATVGAVLLVAGAVFAAGNLRRLRILRAPTPERQAVERIAGTIRGLPTDAVIYGRGWWQAPVVAFFSGRKFADLDEIPGELLETELGRHYFVADDSFTTGAKRDHDLTLARMDYEVVDRAPDQTLVRVRRLHPYPPFEAAERRADLASRVALQSSDYPHVRGLLGAAGGGRWARRFAGILLARAPEQCLHLKLWIPEVSGYRGARVRLTVEVDDLQVLTDDVASAGRWERVLRLPEPPPGRDDGAIEVELATDRWWRPWIGNFNQFSFLLSEAGLVDCAGTSPGGAPAGILSSKN